jgi:hypothetical protein
MEVLLLSGLLGGRGEGPPRSQAELGYVFSVSDPLFCRVRCADRPPPGQQIEAGPHSGPYKIRQIDASTPLNTYELGNEWGWPLLTRNNCVETNAATPRALAQTRRGRNCPPVLARAETDLPANVIVMSLLGKNLGRGGPVGASAPHWIIRHNQIRSNDLQNTIEPRTGFADVVYRTNRIVGLRVVTTPIGMEWSGRSGDDE